MPRRKSLQTVCVETIFFIIMAASVGHLCVNFWERYILQTELSNMKCSLHSLKETINNIGHAYDNLHKELRGLAQIAEKKHSTMIYHKNDPFFYKCKKYKDLNSNKYSALAQPGHDVTVETINKSMYNVSTKIDKAFISNETTQGSNKSGRTVVLPTSGKNATTITKYPPKSTGVGADAYKCKFDENPTNDCCRNRENSGYAHKCYIYEDCNNCKF